MKYPERGSTKRAIVVASDLGFGLANMYEKWSTGLPQVMRVFRDINEAERWLLDDNS